MANRVRLRGSKSKTAPSDRSRKSSKRQLSKTGRREAASRLRYPGLAEAAGEGLNILRGEIGEKGPQRASFIKRLKVANEMLEGVQRYARGELGEVELLHQNTELQQKYPFLKLTPPPGWADPKKAYAILDWIRNANEQHRGAAEEFISWLQKQFGHSRGRPVNPVLTELGHNVSRLRSGGKSWGEIARKVCPRRKEKDHTCSKACADRLRQLVRQFESNS